MRGRSLSFRLAIASVAAVALAVLVFGIAARVVVSDRMHASLDDSLRRRATDVARLAVSAPALLRSPGALESPLSGHQLSVEVLDAEGAIVARSLSLGAKLLPRTSAEATARRGGTAFADAELGGEGIRIFAAPVARAGGPASGGVVLVAGSLADIEGTEHRLGLLLLLCGAGAVAIGGGLAAFLARRGTRPLRDLSSSAATVARTEDPARRLVEPAGPAEVAELASTLNAMLDALAAARERERRLLADASHELRTPLTSLSGNVEFVARHGADPEVVADLEADAARLKLLVDDLLALERESAAPRPREPVRLDELAREAAAGRPAVRVEVDEPLTVSGEPDALARALENLLDNAARYGPPGGAVRLRLRRAGEEAELSVTDGGPGFRPGTEEAAFGRFWRGGDGDAPGAGLGLAIVRATAERHGGRAWASGSTVTLVLPLTSGRTGDVAGRGKAKGTGVRARVRGSVQAVGFREAAVRRARELGVFGWVRNEDDGSVLVQAEGADEAVEAFLGWLGAGPRGAVVDEVEVEKGKVEGHEQFAIRGVSAGAFVVQEHQATAHHWDLRLEVDGVMRSWAVPKGPSMDPAQKRLAVQVEDHQKSHNDFEGKAGEGGVIVWDRGTYEQGGRVPWPEAIERGHAVFVLHGEKLEGGFALQRTRPGEKPQWLLIKRKDDAARPGSDVVVESPESVVSGKTLADVVAAD